MFKRLLSANRGEIALRIIRACRELGITSIAVYSEADENSLHVQFADEAICIGPASPKDSYLKISNIISAAEIANVDAIHPGYGFLAENAHFASICESCNIKFIGPTPENIILMGDKAKARETVQKSGVPTPPGSDGIVKTPEEALGIAHKIGYPVLLKASAGGGGKGMRVAHNDMSLKQGFMMAANEAEQAFGCADIYVEKMIEKARHVEVQIMADSHRNVVHFGERDCSIQRRHQKLLEECPCPILTSDQRRKMGKAAIKVAEAINYVGAGTVEFLLADDGNFYFMEMNTRIQVEHPITEIVCGIDLLKEQIRVATGEKLSVTQKEIVMNGHAIEWRVNAEDPFSNFRPSPGVIEWIHFPGGPGIRIDSHVYSGYEISPFYDSMIAKLIVHGRDRAEAIARLSSALSEFSVEGPETTIPLGKALIADAQFRQGEYDTKYLDSFLKDGLGAVCKK
ncbi:MAG: acetyl-CoA carboxylase biotin carboxylase subunit [Lentisphaerae bacterium]|nr:acetyl-CoA carboxylase biotin carboxylase subunit [Lentisphaerota bacterium]